MSVRAELLALVAFTAFMEGCAAVAPPTGGPKDTVPPRRIASSPDSAARNVKQRFVRLAFSEPIQVKELSKNLLITPQLPADNPYKLRQERSAVTLVFEKPLDENTTYSFNFREAVVDANESLPARNAVVNFSTGPMLDAGSLRGSVTDLLSTQPVAEIAVGLYRETDTAGVRRSKPYYVVRTDKQGLYSFGFLKAGRYHLYAVADKNQNGLYDDGEKIAYQSAPVTIETTGNAAAVPLVLTQPDRRAPLISEQQAGPTELRLNFKEGLRTVTMVPLPLNPALAAAMAEAVLLTERGRTVLFFKTDAVGEGRYLLTATDSTGNVGHDTLNVRFPVPPATVKKKPAPTLYSLEGSTGTVYRQGQVKFRFLVPVRIAAGKPFGTLVEDTLRRRPLQLPTDATLSPDHTLLTIRLSTRAKNRVDIQLDSTAITSITGQPLRLRPQQFGLSEQGNLGSLTGTIATKEASFELQLLDDKLQVISSLNSPKGSFKFDNLAPGTYRLRVLVDQDGDGRWRGGDPNLKLPPELVYLHPKALQVRANWEVEEKISF